MMVASSMMSAPLFLKNLFTFLMSLARNSLALKWSLVTA